MSLKDFNDEDVKTAIEYNCKQWCGNHSVKYNPDNIVCPVSQEEHAGVVASKTEGMVFSFDYQGKRVYGYYKASKPQAAINNIPAAGSDVPEHAGLMDTASTIGGSKLPILGKSNFSDAYREIKYIYNSLFEIRDDVTDAITTLQKLEKQLEVLDAQAQTFVSKSKSNRAAKGRSGGRSISSVSNKTSKHENSKGRKPAKEPAGVLL